MNATSLTELRNTASMAADGDERMSQIRELLIGDYQRDCEARLSQLEARQREFETLTARRLDALQARLDALAGEVSAAQRTAFDELSRGVKELGDNILRIARE